LGFDRRKELGATHYISIGGRDQTQAQTEFTGKSGRNPRKFGFGKIQS